VKKIFLLSCFLFSITSYSQIIDSVYLLNQNTPPQIHIYGKLYHTGFSINHIDSEISDTVEFSIYFKECIGAQVITPFDTVLSFSESWPTVPQGIKVLSILDTNTVDSNCALVGQLDTLGVNVFPTSMLNLESNFSISKFIQIYPNPTADVLQLTVLNKTSINIIRLFDSQGKLIKAFDGEVKDIDVSDLSSGIYYLKVQATQGEMVEKIMIE
jgi:hypothetical protein